MSTRRYLLAAVVVATSILGSVPAGADDATLDDPAGDVATAETGAPSAERRVDITEVFVQHEVDLLEITVTPAQFTPLDDPVWSSGQLGLQVTLVDPTSSDPFGGVWIWSLVPGGDGEASGLLTSFETFTDCTTDARADATTGTYALSAGPACLRGVARSLGVGTVMAFDPNLDDDDFDTPIDLAPEELSAPIGATGVAEIVRLAGRDRIETAIALSVDRFTDGAAGAAVLASSADHPDAIAGGPLAARNAAPLLLTGGTALDPRVADELARAVEPGAVVYLLGGTGVLGEPVAAQVRSLGLRPKRLAGSNRFETAIAIADEIGEHAITMIADGRSVTDGLIAGAAAASLGGVVVLSDGTSLPAATDEFLASDATRHVAIGVAADPARGAERIVAGSAPELSQKVLDRLLPGADLIAVAGTGTFADALAGAPHVAALGGGLLLTDSNVLAPAVRAELTQRKDDMRELLLFGGTASISQPVADAIATAIS